MTFIFIYMALGITFFSFLKTSESTEGALDFFFYYRQDINSISNTVVFFIAIFIVSLTLIYVINTFNIFEIGSLEMSLLLGVLISSVILLLIVNCKTQENNLNKLLLPAWLFFPLVFLSKKRELKEKRELRD